MYQNALCGKGKLFLTTKVLNSEQHPSIRTHNLQPHTTPTTIHNQSYVPHAVNNCIVSSSWWWANWCPKHVERII